jgi:SH3-like domain-containing protein
VAQPVIPNDGEPDSDRLDSDTAVADAGDASNDAAAKIATIVPVPDVRADIADLLPDLADNAGDAKGPARPASVDATPEVAEVVALAGIEEASALPTLPLSRDPEPSVDLSALETLEAPLAIDDVLAPKPEVAAPSVTTAAAAPLTPQTLAPRAPLHGAPDAGNSTPEIADPDKLAGSNPVGIQQVVYVTGSRVNLRKGPSTNFDVVSVEDHGAKLRLLGTQGRWTKVAAVTSDYQGWMSSRYLATDRPEAPVKKAAVTRVTKKKSPAKRAQPRATNNRVSASTARRAIIRQALASSSAECPCPFSRDRAGKLCGGKSVWNRNGGGGQICFDGDVSKSMIQRWIARH